MTNIQRLKSNGILWNTLGSCMFAANSMLLLLMVSWYSDMQSVGVFSIAFTTAQLLYIVGLFGMNTYQMTDYHEKYSFGDYRSAKLLLSLAMLLSAFACILMLRFSSLKALYTILLTIYMMINSYAELYQSLFFQKNRLDLSGKSMFYRTLISTAAFGIILFLSRTVAAALVGMIVVNAITTFLIAIRPAKYFISKQNLFCLHSARPLLLECFPIFLSVFLMTFMTSCPKYIIDGTMTDEFQGYFNIIFMPAQVINLLSGFVFKPALNQYAGFLEQHEKKPFWNLLWKQLGLVVGVTLLCCVGAYWLGIPVLNFLYQTDISDYRATLLVVVCGGGCLAVCALLYHVLIIARKQKLTLLGYLICSAIVISLSLFSVRVYGITGAAWSFLLSYFVLTCLFLLLVLLLFGRKKDA